MHGLPDTRSSLSSYYNSLEVGVPVNEIYDYPIFSTVIATQRLGTGTPHLISNSKYPPGTPFTNIE